MLRVKGVNPIYLALVLNSKIGRMQTDKYCKGSAQFEIYPDDIAKFVVPILSTEIQDKIAKLVLESVECKKKSKQLLLDVKDIVKVEIEKITCK